MFQCPPLPCIAILLHTWWSNHAIDSDHLGPCGPKLHLWRHMWVANILIFPCKSLHLGLMWPSDVGKSREKYNLRLQTAAVCPKTPQTSVFHRKRRYGPYHHMCYQDQHRHPHPHQRQCHCDSEGLDYIMLWVAGGICPIICHCNRIRGDRYRGTPPMTLPYLKLMNTIPCY